jgi:hypothetical protein
VALLAKRPYCSNGERHIMASPGGKLIALASHPTRKVNKAEEPTYPSANIACDLAKTSAANLFDI